MYKCPYCGFECVSYKIFNQHMEREYFKVSEYDIKRLIKQYGKEWRDHITEYKENRK